MKKTTLGLAVLTLLFTACSKDDKGGDNNPGEHNWQVSRIMMAHDTLRFTYNADGTVHKLYDYSQDGDEYLSDSMEIAWEGGRIIRLSEFEDGVKRPYAELIYDGNNVVRLQYYRENETGYGPGGYDSIRYANGKMSEIHYINNQGDRSSYHKLTWTGDNITKDELYAQNFDGTNTFMLMEEVTYTYHTDKPGLGKLTSGDVLFWYADMELTHISANLVASSVTVYKPTEQERWRSDYTHTFSTDGLLESTVTKETDVEADRTSEYTSKFEYIDLK
ncbi:hypothetical protein [Chitinophaga cymbidii]|uniref:DUF4595 domain-containing protein n=1 Tax=Chitinophaga cymbidii TaxID=1096750 RepID=A0A512RDS1_9BACT|nr:hypothetical protein [Chitinophaga cymbidii]GEP93842.1 hypothetical protein CCY01nite_01020 [Chitinophaga cymbidii]